MPLPRRLEPELLDELPADDPRALRGRRDLARMNALLGQTRLMSRLLRKHSGPAPPRTWLELGAGDGTFTLSVAQRVARFWPKVHVMLLDQQQIVGETTRQSFASFGWTVEMISADVYECLDRPRPAGVDVVTANLFIHHVPPDRLAWLLQRVAQMTQLFVACEPRRSRLALQLIRQSWMAGYGEVFMHDAIVSARAGFAGRELSDTWPRGAAWRLAEHRSGLFMHCFAARRG